MNKIKEFKNKHNTLLKVSGCVTIALVSFGLGRKFEDQSIISSLEYLARNEQCRYMDIKGVRYILSMIKESEIISKIEK